VLSEALAAALLGFALAASPGPVNALAFAHGLRDGPSRALLLVLGADTADMVYATLVMLGAAPFVNRPSVQIVLSIAGGLFLAHLAVGNLRAAWRDGPAAAEAGRETSRLAVYREGFLVALLSPLTIVFWMSVFGGYYAAATARGSRMPPVLLLASLMAGAAIWTACVALLIHFGRKGLRGRWYAVLVTVLSIALLVWALRLLWTGGSSLRVMVTHRACAMRAWPHMIAPHGGPTCRIPIGSTRTGTTYTTTPSWPARIASPSTTASS
jgi:threonine/homoserine/homoserine lactone efflux protein